MGAERIHSDLAVGRARAVVVGHRLRRLLISPAAWKIFMEHHVFAVWDFMSLIKRLQRELTCVEIPWLAPVDPRASRFINSVVLAEESDDDGAGGCTSHFALYLAAMAEAGADSGPATAFVQLMRGGEELGVALKMARAPAGVEPFVQATLQLAIHGRIEEVAAAFFYGREQIIPDMFGGLVGCLDQSGQRLQKMRFYLDRHVELDAEEHGPMARAMLTQLCGESADSHGRATAAALACLAERARLWDAICVAIESSKATSG